MPEIGTWAQWGRMFTDVELWTPVVREICRRESIRFQEVEAGYPGTNAVYILDRRYVVKIYAPFCHKDYERECDLYPLLERRASIPVPRLYAQGVWTDRIEWPYVVIEYLPGRPIGEVRDEIEPRNHAEIAAHLGRMLRELHALPLDSVRALDRSWEGWTCFLESRKAEIASELEEETALPSQVIDECSALLEERWEGLQTPQPARSTRPLALLNADVTEDHVLVQREDGCWRISGLIDFADAVIGQVEYEWIAVWFGAMGREVESMRALMGGYDASVRLDAAFVDRAMAFTLLHQFGAGIIGWGLKSLGDPSVRSAEELQRVLWGKLVEGGSSGLYSKGV